jgi:hypothetical protein
MDDDAELTPAEAARRRRRDRDADAQARAGMRTGLAKQFKQVLDTQRKRAEADLPPANDPATDPSTDKKRPRKP